MSLYGRILRTPHVAVLVAATTLGRIPFAINALAILLFLRAETGSFAIAGLTTGALALGGGAASPFVARLVDRRGTALLLPLAFGYATAVLGIWALGSANAPAPLLALVAFAAGASFPPTGAVLRSRWPSLLRGDPAMVRAAYAFDSATIEISFVSGPLVVAAIVAVAEPQVALAVAAALEVIGTAVFVWKLPGPHEAEERPEPAGGLLGALSAPAIRVIALTTVPFGFCIGAIEVAIPAFAEAEGATELSGVLLALWSLASGVGGLLFGLRAGGRGLVETYLLVALVFPLTVLPMAAGTSPLVMGALVMLAGAPIAPLIASRNELIAAVAPAGTGAEAFTWLMTALVAGLSAGAALGGVLIEADGWQAAVLAGVGASVLGALLVIARRGAFGVSPATA
jgi:MFS family permease